jgi:hypothetical protein
MKLFLISVMLSFANTIFSQEKPVTFKIEANGYTTLSEIFTAAELSLQKGSKDPEGIKGILSAKIDSYRASYPEDGAMKEFLQTAVTNKEFTDRLRQLPKGTKVFLKRSFSNTTKVSERWMYFIR